MAKCQSHVANFSMQEKNSSPSAETPNDVKIDDVCANPLLKLQMVAHHHETQSNISRPSVVCRLLPYLLYFIIIYLLLKLKIVLFNFQDTGKDTIVRGDL